MPSLSTAYELVLLEEWSNDLCVGASAFSTITTKYNRFFRQQYGTDIQQFELYRKRTAEAYMRLVLGSVHAWGQSMHDRHYLQECSMTCTGMIMQGRQWANIPAVSACC